MQRALSLRPPYGTAFITQPDGTIWLIYDTTHLSVEKLVEWLRDAALNHEAECKANDEAMRAHQETMKRIPKEDKERQTKLRAHNWGGTYRLGAKCVDCGAVANGLEPAECSDQTVE